MSDLAITDSKQESTTKPTASECGISHKSIQDFRLDRQHHCQAWRLYVIRLAPNAVNDDRVAGMSFEVNVKVQALVISSLHCIKYATFGAAHGQTSALLLHQFRQLFRRRVVYQQAKLVELFEVGKLGGKVKRVL